MVSDLLELSRAAHEAGSREAWIDREGTLSFAELAEAARSISDRWPSLSPGDRALITPTLDRDSALAILALLDRRVTIVLSHPRWAPLERERALELARPRLVFEGSELVARHPRAPHDRAPAVIVFTSGTSGVPKGVCLSRSALIAAAEAHGATLPWIERDRWLLAMPLAHIGGLMVMLRCLAARRAVVLGPDRFEPRALLDAAREREATLVSLVPTMLERILPAPPPPSVRAVLLGGAACPTELLARGRSAGWPLLPTYGLSEHTAQVCTQRLDSPRPSGVGPPLPGIELRVERGVVEVRGPARMDGYLGEPPLAPDAWVRTGDLGRLDDEGHLHVGGREDDRIVTGGENVDPLAVEDALASHPDVAAACVVGVDDPRWGQRAVALVVPRDPARAPRPEDLAAHLETRVAAFARPREWHFVDALPLGPSGKVDRRAARERGRT